VLKKNYMVKNEESGPSIKQELNIKDEPSDFPKIDLPGIKQEIDFLGIKKELCDLPNIKEDVAWFPQDWEAVYLSIRKMRENRTAPVDSMGCERCNDVDAPPQVQRFQCLISLMLSSQTKDEVNFAAMTRLREHGLTVQNIIDTSEDIVGKLIYPVGFWKTKAKYIKEVVHVLKDNYDCDIPRTVKDLCKLKGVGPKMAHICMSSAWGEPSGIGVDTHVHRISGRLGWTQKECKTPEATRMALESWLPKDLWVEINWMLVGFGQEICRPVGPKCGECLNKDICPTGQKWVPSPKKKVSPKKKAN